MSRVVLLRQRGGKKAHLHHFFATPVCFGCSLLNSDPSVVPGTLVYLLLNLDVPYVAVDCCAKH